MHITGRPSLFSISPIAHLQNDLLSEIRAVHAFIVSFITFVALVYLMHNNALLYIKAPILLSKAGC